MSYSFNGTSHYLSRTASTPLTATPFTIIAWVKVDDTATVRSVCVSYRQGSSTNYFQVQLNSTEVPQMVTRHNVDGQVLASAASAATPGAWKFIHGKSASSTSRFAGVDGASGTENTTDRTPSGTLDAIQIGMRPTNLEWYDGLIGLVAIYNGALSESELAELATTAPESASTFGDCVAYWDLRTDHGTTTIPDSKGSYDLTVNGATFNADNPNLGPAGKWPQYQRHMPNVLLRR